MIDLSLRLKFWKFNDDNNKPNSHDKWNNSFMAWCGQFGCSEIYRISINSGSLQRERESFLKNTLLNQSTGYFYILRLKLGFYEDARNAINFKGINLKNADKSSCNYFTIHFNRVYLVSILHLLYLVGRT